MTNQIKTNRQIFQIGILTEDPVIEEDKSIISSVMSFFQNKSEITNTNIPKIESLFNDAFKNKDFDTIKTMMNSGYIISKDQKEMITIYFNNLIERDSVVEINNLIDNKINPSQENIHKMFFNTYNSIYLSPTLSYNEAKKNLSEDKVKELYPNGTPEIDPKYNNIFNIINRYLSTNKNNLFDNWKYLLDNYPFSTKISFDYAIVKNLEVFMYDYIAKLNLDDKLNIVANIDRLNTHTSLVWNEIKPKLTNSFSIEKEFYLTQLSHSIQSNYESTIEINVNNINKLPDNIKNIVLEINDISQYIIKQNDIDTSYKDNILKIGIDKTNDILEQYFNIDPEFRNQIKSSQNKNSDELLIDSINNIHKAVLDIYREINQSKVSELSATNRYTKKISS